MCWSQQVFLKFGDIDRENKVNLRSERSLDLEYNVDIVLISEEFSIVGFVNSLVTIVSNTPKRCWGEMVGTLAGLDQVNFNE